MKNNINTINFICLFLSFCFILGCSTDKKNKEMNTSKEEQVHKIEYNIDKSLNLQAYSSFKGYTPQEGFVPTAELAVSIAEQVLVQIYGKEQIEKQKPFSINIDNGIWVIEGFWDKSDYQVDGGNVYLEMDKLSGKILKVVHTK